MDRKRSAHRASPHRVGACDGQPRPRPSPFLEAPRDPCGTTTRAPCGRGSPARAPCSRSGCRCRHERSPVGILGKLDKYAWFSSPLASDLHGLQGPAPVEQGLLGMTLQVEDQDPLVLKKTRKMAPK